MPAIWGKPPRESGRAKVEASRASSSSAPVTYTTATVLPKGSTVFTSSLEMSPLWIQARMPPPLVMATTFSAGTVSSASLRMAHSMESVIRSPRLVSWVRLPGSLSPLSSTSVLAKTLPYSALMSLMILSAAAFTVASSLV